MPEVTRVGRGLGTEVAKLKPQTCGLPYLVET